MAGTERKSRHVRCAKCLRVLIEPADVPIYQCGICGTFLQSKYYLATNDVQVNEVNRQQNSCEQGENDSKIAVSKTDQLAFTNIPETTYEDHGDKSSQIEMKSFSKEDTEESTKHSHQDSDSSLLCVRLGKALNTDQPASESSMEYSFESEQEESIKIEDRFNESSFNPPEVSQSGSSPSLTSERLEESPEFFIHNVDSKEYLSEVQEKGCLESCIDNKMDNRSTPKLQENAVKSLSNRHMHRLISNKEALSSSSYQIPRAERGVSLDSGNFHSVQDWLDSDCPTETLSRRTTFNGDSCNYENGNTSTKFENHGRENTELLRKVKELSHQLSNLYDERDSNSRSNIRVPPRQPLFDNHNYGLEFSKYLNPNLTQYPPGGYCRSRTSGTRYYPLEDHHLQFQPNLCHSGSCSAYAYNMHSHPSNATNPRGRGSSIPPCCSENHMHNLDIEKTVYREKRQPLIHHCRPVSGAAPFVICDKCLELLQLPVDFLISRKRMQKLKCGACSKVLLLSFQAGVHPTRRSLSHPRNVPGGNHLSMSEDYGLSFSQNYSPETAHAQSISASSSEKKRAKDSPNFALHRLMGYSSATEILYQPSDVDEGYETAQPV